MSTLKTNTLQHLDSGSANIELAKGGGAIHSGISTFNKVSVGSATTFTDDLVVNGDARITGILTIGTGSITLDPNNDEIKLGQTKLKRESDGEIKITDLQGNLKGLRGKRFRIQVTASEKNKNGVEVGTGATITSPNDNELAFRTNDEPRVKIDSSGKVGIGKTDPNTLLHVHGSSSTQKLVRFTSGSSERNNYIGVVSSDNLEIGADEDNEGNDSSIRFRVDGTERLRIKSDGDTSLSFNLLIPEDKKIHLEGISSDDYNAIWKADTENTVFVTSRFNIANIIDSNDDDTTSFWSVRHNGTTLSGSSELMRVGSDGKVGINATSPNARLELKESDGNIAFKIGNSAETYNRFQIYPRSSGDTDYHTIAYFHKDNYPLNHYTYAGTSYNYASVMAGRTRSNAASPTNYYRHGSHSFDAYSARTDDQQNYRSRIFMRAWDGGDDGDRNAIYYVNSGSDTTSVDYDQHQKFGIKGNGMTQCGSSVYAGRVESDESTPNSVYGGTSGTTVIVYPGSSAQYTRMDARTTSGTDQVFKADTGIGVCFKVEASGKVEADGSFSNPATDYAEYFEWTDGNTSSADRRGITVVMDGEKIRPATNSDDTSKIIGVVSALPSIVGDAAWSKWHLALQNDVYGSWVTEDKEYLVWNKFGTFTDTDGVKKPNPQPDINDYNMSSDFQILVSDIEEEKAKGNVPQAAIDQNLRYTRPSRVYNPDYDPTRDYVPRSHRKEWDAIGLLGKLVVRRGQPIGSNWILMRSNVGVDPNDNSIILDRYLVR